MVKYYQCIGTGLLFPADFVKNWGRDGYGSGLGSKPVSECLETAWDMPAARPKVLINPEQIMIPLGCPKYSLQLVYRDKEAKSEEMAILMKDDPNYTKRAKLIRDKQLANKNGILKHSLN